MLQNNWIVKPHWLQVKKGCVCEVAIGTPGTTDSFWRKFAVAGVRVAIMGCIVNGSITLFFSHHELVNFQRWRSMKMNTDEHGKTTETTCFRSFYWTTWKRSDRSRHVDVDWNSAHCWNTFPAPMCFGYCCRFVGNEAWRNGWCRFWLCAAPQCVMRWTVPAQRTIRKVAVRVHSQDAAGETMLSMIPKFNHGCLQPSSRTHRKEIHIHWSTISINSNLEVGSGVGKLESSEMSRHVKTWVCQDWGYLISPEFSWDQVWDLFPRSPMLTWLEPPTLRIDLYVKYDVVKRGIPSENAVEVRIRQIWMANLRWSWENGLNILKTSDSTPHCQVNKVFSWWLVIVISIMLCMQHHVTNSKYWWNLFDVDSTRNEGRSGVKKIPRPSWTSSRSQESQDFRPLDRWKFKKKSKGFCISESTRGMAAGLSQRRRKMWRLRLELQEDGQVEKVG